MIELCHTNTEIIMQLPLKLALSTFQGFIYNQIPLFDTHIYKKRGNPNFSSKWHGMETKPIRLPVAYHETAIAYCQNLLKGKLQPNDVPIQIQPDPDPVVLSLEEIQDLKEIKDLYGDLVAEKIRSEMMAEKTKPDPVDRPVTLSSGSSIAELDPRDILADPKRFQFKMIHNAKTGSSASLKGVVTWNEALSGLILVWRDPQDNKIYVVNGHNRLSLAKNLEVSRIAVRFVDCDNALQARLLGAIANISEGKGSSLDAAKIFRDMSIGQDDLKNFGVTLSDKLADHGMAIANLADHFFDMAMIGDLAENIAVTMGYLPLDFQDTFYQLVKKDKRKLSFSELNELSKVVLSSVSVESSQSSLFGDILTVENLAIEKAQLNAYILSRLKRDKYLFSVVSQPRNANELSRGNNQIDTATSLDIAESAKTAINIFDKLKNLTGQVSQRINESAIALRNGENSTAIKTNLYQWIVDHLTTDNAFNLAS